MASATSRLTVRFAGIELRSPIIAASAPPTESVAGMLSCAKAGAGAVITKSIIDYNREEWPHIPRRVRREPRRLWIQGSFASETLTLSEGLAIVSATRTASDIPIIASVGVLDPTSNQAVDTALRLVEAGADLIHFDLFYLPQPRCSDEMIGFLANLFERARAELPVQFGPKLNVDIPADRFAQAFKPSSIDCVFLLDSIRVPPPINSRGSPTLPNWHGGLECSLFGEWQKPITMQYTRVLSDAGMSNLCVGGGLRGATDVLEAILLGATTTQIASQIITQGYDWISRTNDKLEALLDANSHPSLQSIKGLGLHIRDSKAPEDVDPVRAIVDDNKCKPCGVCTTLAFCSFISKQSTGIPTISDACYGCGLCEQLCPQPGAISMKSLR